MTKMIKMSLIAAVAVTGMTSTVCAQPLEEAIKGVDVSGMLRYRYEDKAQSYHSNDYRLEVNTKAKVNDAVTANVGIFTHARTDNNGADANAVDQDANPSLTVRHANFTVAAAGMNVTAGKQALNTPFTDGTDQQGTGALVVAPLSGVTLAAGYFMNNSITNGADALDAITLFPYKEDTVNIATNDILVVAAMAKVADIDLDAWYASVGEGLAGSTTPKGLDAYTIGAKTSIAGVTLDLRHSNLEVDGATTDNSLTKLVASTKVASANIVAGYVATGKDGGLVAFDNDAATSFKVFQLTANNLKDADAFHIGADMDVMANLNVKASYTSADFKTGTVDTDASELLLAVAYKMGKNFGVTATISDYSVDVANAVDNDDDDMRGRLEVKYTF